MDGVTILNMFVEELAVVQPWMTIGLSLSIGGVIGLVVCAIITIAYEDYTWTGIVVTSCAICVLTGIAIGMFAPRETENRYQVIIDDSVSFNEFQEHYKILEVNGKIYTVKVLTNEE